VVIAKIIDHDELICSIRPIMYMGGECPG